MHETSGTITAKEVLDHQEAFAAGYADDEYALLGMAVTYTKLHGQTITIAGNPDTSVFLFRLLIQFRKRLGSAEDRRTTQSQVANSRMRI